MTLVFLSKHLAMIGSLRLRGHRRYLSAGSFLPTVSLKNALFALGALKVNKLDIIEAVKTICFTFIDFIDIFIYIKLLVG